MILAEDLLLLLTDDESGKGAVDSTRMSLGLAGAVMLELAMLGKVDVVERDGWFTSKQLIVRDETPTGDPVLDEGLRRIIAAGPKKPQSMLSALGKGLREGLLQRLAERGILRLEHGKVLGIFPTRSWPAVDSSHEEQLRAGLHDVLVVGRTPTSDEAALVALLNAVGQVPKVVAATGVSARELRRRAKELSEGNFASEAVRKAIEAVSAATTAAIVASTAAAGSSG